MLTRPSRDQMAMADGSGMAPVGGGGRARLLLYAVSLEQGARPLPSNPAVVVAVNGNNLIIQSFAGKQEQTLPAGDPRPQHTVGEVIAL